MTTRLSPLIRRASPTLAANWRIIAIAMPSMSSITAAALWRPRMACPEPGSIAEYRNARRGLMGGFTVSAGTITLSRFGLGIGRGRTRAESGGWAEEMGG